MTQTTAKQPLLAGVDVGSTTTKIVILGAEDRKIYYSRYRRHNAAQAASVRDALQQAAKRFPGHEVRLALTGSGAKRIAESLDVPYIQEVVANSIALREDYSQVRTAVELGGQDAKMIFFKKDPDTGTLNVADMRMNGSCAGGTGAFIDEIASLLKIPIEEFDGFASRGDCVYDISGRCGVYAKTDIQPLLNQGVSKENLALSSFHAIAKQTIGGLAQGLDIEKPVVFEGGPLTFNPTLIRVFAERLGLSDEETVIPEHPEIMIAYGAALSLDIMFSREAKAVDLTALCRILETKKIRTEEGDSLRETKPFFTSRSDYEEFMTRHAKPDRRFPGPVPGTTVRAYLGIDSGSTTTKFVLIDEDENILGSFYSPNEGDPLIVAKNALIALRDRYRAAGARLDILAVGSTGYGELLFSKAFGTEFHVVETVAHARAAAKYVDDATFILDIGGQDMKAIWLDHGIITNIVVNEACSSGCGSFLENFAANLQIPVEEIAASAFSSGSPAALGSRCTVFMNSSIVTEQRNGKSPSDIMAGLCRSIIENVFTKVIRISNLDSLGDRIVVQGGTFENDAVLRALEQHLGRNVTRAPYPGIMGAIGAALLTKENWETSGGERTFIGLDAMDDFSYRQESNAPCPFCTNHCRRTIVTFSSGQSWVTNNRCERGEILGDPKDARVRAQLKETKQARDSVPNLFRLREQLLFQDYEYPKPAQERECTIGLPRVLSFWDTMPFWSTFWKALGFRVRISDPTTRKIYESGLSAVTSDTVCFPAKLTHGAIRNLAEKYQVDRIFMPSITTLSSENTEKTSQSMCAVVKGYPLVIRNSDNPARRFDIPFDAPLFHWYQPEDRRRQLTGYMKETFDIPEAETLAAMEAGDAAQALFRRRLKEAGQAVIDDVTRRDTYAVILASRPYQNDPLVNHGLPEMFASLGIPVLTADSVPGSEKVDLSMSRLDVVNNFHARMLSTAVMAAQNDHLEYVQIVSFGCGHDAYLSDEIIRLMKEISGKTPLILKLDESDIQGPLRIRVRSFTETLAMRRAQHKSLAVKALTDPYPVKFTKKDVKERIVLVPNTSHAFCRVISAAFQSQHIRAVPLEYGREEAIRLGKQYVHNDICFPAQIVIGEILAALKSGQYDGQEIAVGMGKYIGDCRLTHYSALLRKAMDDAGFPDVPILTNDDVDYHNLHPGFRMNLYSSVLLAFALPMIDVLEELLRKTRPYETEPGAANRAFGEAMDALVDGMGHGIHGMRTGFARSIEIMKNIPYDRSRPKPTVLIVGEYLLNFHPGANHDIEDYLEKNGFEIIEARMTDVIQKTYFYQDSQVKQYHVKKPLGKKAYLRLVDTVFSLAHDMTDSLAKAHPLYKKAARLEEIAADSDPIIPRSFDAGEGILIPGEILHHAKEGCRSFVILQPFGCLPNHVVGRGVSKKLKELYPDAQILPLDYDPDVSFANIENRLQMLIMNERAKEEQQDLAI